MNSKIGEFKCPEILDSKMNLKAIIDSLPNINNFMSTESCQYLESVIKILTELGIPVVHDQRLVGAVIITHRLGDNTQLFRLAKFSGRWRTILYSIR